MLTLNDGRSELWQWDTGRTATVDIECDIVHFSCLEYGKAPAVKVKGGIVEIPNDLLMLGADIKAWAFIIDSEGGYTKEEQVLKVNKRPKPSDYVYTETEVLSYEALERRVTELEKGGTVDGDAILEEAKKYTDNKAETVAEEVTKISKEYTDSQITEYVGEISKALDELHEYTQALINGGTTEEIITFSLEGYGDEPLLFEAIKGMTWRGWIDSDFNTEKKGFLVNGNTITFNGIAVVASNGNRVLADDIIVDAETYYVPA